MTSKWYDWFNSRKMWVAGVVGVVMDLVAMVQIALEDEAITFDEIGDFKTALVLALGTIFTMVGVYKSKNQPSPTS